MESMALVEDPQNATARRLVAEALGGPVAGDATQPAALQNVWVSGAPVAVKMRLFCLPYAGGVSENVFGRRGFCSWVLAWRPLPAQLNSWIDTVCSSVASAHLFMS